MSVDVVCADPVFLDLTFDGLEALPGPGEERFATRLACARPAAARSPRSALARLGLERRARRAARRRPRRRHRCARAARRRGRRAAPGRRVGAHARDGRHAGRRRARDGHLRAGGASRPRARSSGCEPRAVVVGARPARPRAGGRARLRDGRRRRRARARRRLPAGARAARARCSSTRRRRAAHRRWRDAEARARARSRERVETAVVTLRRRRAPSRPSDGELVAVAGARGRGAWTRPAPATCSPPRTSGRTSQGCRSRSGCGGRSCTPPSRCGRPPGPRARPPRDELEQRARRARARRPRIGNDKGGPDEPESHRRSASARARRARGCGAAPARRRRRDARATPAATAAPRRRRQGRRRHADRLGPGGPRRPGEADQAAQRSSSRSKYPNVKIKRVAKSFTDLSDDAQARGLRARTRPTSSRPTRATRSMGPLVKAGLLLPLDDYADSSTAGRDRYSPGLLTLNRFTRDGKSFGSRQPLRPLA